MADTNNEPRSLRVLAIKGVTMFSFQNVLLQVIWFLTSLVLLNSITVVDYSVLKLVFAAIAVPSALYIAGIDPIVLADMGVEREFGRLGVLKGLFRAYVIFEVLSACILWSGFILLLTAFKGHFSPLTYQYIFAASFIILSRPLQNILFQLFGLFLRFQQMTFLKLYDEGLTLLAMVYFVFYLRQGVYAAILIQVVAPLVAVTLSLPAFFILYRKQLRGVRREKAGFFARLRAHGKWSIAAAYVVNGWDALRLFFIDHFIGREAVALYSLADSLWGHLISLFPVKSILSAMLPQRTKDETTARHNLIRGFKYSFLGFTILGLLSAVTGYQFLRIFFPKYIAAFPIFLGFLLMIPKFSFSSALSPLLRAYKFQLAGFLAALFSLVLTVAFAYILYPRLGMKGVVAETVITNTILICLVYKAFIRKYPAFRLRMREIFSWDRYDADTIRMLVKSFLQRLKLV